jgi:putative transposase
MGVTKYQKTNRSKHLMMAHVILSTKYRKKTLDRLGDDVKQLIFEISNKYKWEIVEMEVDKYHIHILIKYLPIDSITDII